MALLEAHRLRVDLRTHRGVAPAVRDMSFTLERGDTLGLIGESGCGKSMTALALMGLAPDNASVSGSLKLDGQQLVGMRERDWRRVRGARIAILAFGTLLHPALAAAERLNATVANMRFAKPVDEALVIELARSHEAIVTVEEGCLPGGAGSAVMEVLHAAGLANPVLALGLPDVFIEHGDTAKLLALNGLDADGIAKTIAARFGARPALVRQANSRGE